MHRRHLLVALAAVLAHPAAAMPRRASPDPFPVPSGPISLAWRWVPGDTWTFRFVTEREVAGRVTARAESWRYLVRGVDRDANATLEGRLVAFGGGTTRDGVPLDDPHPAAARDSARSDADRPVTLRLGMDGRIVSLDARAFGDALPHRLIGLGLPAVPIDRRAEWPLPDLLATFRGLLPPAVDLDTRASARLLEVYAEDGRAITEIETTGALRSPHGPAVHLSGTAAWDATRGGLLRRTLQARFTPSTPDPAQNPGVLRVAITRT